MWGTSEAFIVFVYDCCDWLKCLHLKKTTWQNGVFTFYFINLLS